MTTAWSLRESAITAPEDWKVARVGDLVDLINGYPFPSEEFSSVEGFPLVRIRDLLSEGFETFVTGSVPERVKIRDGDVVIGMDGDFNLSVWDRGPAALNQRLCLLRPKPGVDIRFVAYSLPPALRIINDLTFSTTVKHLSSGQILSERIPLPPLSGQRRIADFLDAEVGLIDRLVAVRRQQIVLLEERFSIALTDRLVPGMMKKVPRGGRWPWLPRDLSTARLGWYARVQTGVTVDSSRTPSEADVEVPYLRVANVQGGKVDLEEVKSITLPISLARKSTLRYGDVVMTEANGNPDNLGRGAVWRNEIEGMIHQNHIFAIRLNQDFILPEYLSFILSSVHGRRYFRFTSNQVGIATTSSSKVLSFPVPKVPVSMQRIVVDECEKLLNLHTESTLALNRQIELLEERKRALITAAVTGQIDVTTARGADLS